MSEPIYEKECSNCKLGGLYPFPDKCWETMNEDNDCPHWEEKE